MVQSHFRTFKRKRIILFHLLLVSAIEVNLPFLSLPRHLADDVRDIIRVTRFSGPLIFRSSTHAFARCPNFEPPQGTLPWDVTRGVTILLIVNLLDAIDNNKIIIASELPNP